MTATALHDPVAEQTLAACAASSLHGARLAAGRVEQTEFYDPRCAAIIAAALEVPDQPGREHAVAEAAGVDEHTVAAWCSAATVIWDTNGTVAARVTAKAADRARIRRLVDELEQLGVSTRVHGL